MDDRHTKAPTATSTTSPVTTPRGARAETAALGTLARLYGVQAAYVDGVGRRRRAPRDTLVAALRALGAPIEGPGDAREAARATELARWRTPLEPVVPIWRGCRPACDLRGPAASLGDRIRCDIQLEDGGRREWTTDLRRCRRTAAFARDGERFVSLRLALPPGLPIGYHVLGIELGGGRRREAFIIHAPRRAYDADHRAWGAFLPTYALHTAESWGVGDFTDLERVAGWLGELGSGLFSTLPLFAAFLRDRPFDPCPYAPASRLFWNELYIDPRRTPEFARSRRARVLAGSAPFDRELAAIRRARHVDYGRVMQLKRRVLELLAAEVETRDDARAAAFRRFGRPGSAVRRYAAFRAVGERLARPWPEWPAGLRAGRLSDGDYDPASQRYHAYVQWIAAQQIAALGDRARASGSGLSLDMPVGVHAHGYDVWAHRALFATGVAAGAPSDALFAKGQNWTLPPLLPEAIRLDRYRYVRATLGHAAAHATTLRLDHVMGLHRLFWIPDGSAATAGVYVRYCPEELYAVLAIESHRHRVAIIGENLGTVPPAVNRAVVAHGLRTMYVQQFEIRPERARPLGMVRRRAVASLNTHDTPTFSGFLHGHDVDTGVALGWVTPRQAAAQRRRRARLLRALARALGATARASDAELLRRCLGRLARSGASLVQVSLEDLWGETAPHNVPGTGTERPNWRRRARFAFEQFRDRPDVVETLQELATLRRRTGDPGPRRRAR